MSCLESCTEMEVEPVTSFWESLKKSLEEEMTEAEWERAMFLMSDKLKQNGIQYPIFSVSEDQKPSDILKIMENNMFEEEAISIVKHVVAVMQYHSEDSKKSFESVIDEYEKKTVSRGAHIIGREGAIQTTLDTISKSETQGMWIYGMGGLGKTVLAQEVCNRLMNKYKFEILHVDLKQAESVGDMLTAIIDSLQLSSTAMDNASKTGEIVCELQSRKTDTCILLDNIEDVYDKHTSNVQKILSQFLEGTARVKFRKIKFLFTCRIAIKDGFSSTIIPMALETLSHKDADHLLMMLCRPNTLNKKEREIIYQMTEGIPYAIRLAYYAIKNKSDLHLDEWHTKQFLSKSLQSTMNDCIKQAFQYLSDIMQSHLKKLCVIETAKFEISDVAAILDIQTEDAITIVMYFTRQQIIQRESIKQKGNQLGTSNSTGYMYHFHPLVVDFLKFITINDIEEKRRVQSRFCTHILGKLEKNIQNNEANFNKTVQFVTSNRVLMTLFFEHYSTYRVEELPEWQSLYLGRLLAFLHTFAEKEKLLNKFITTSVNNNDVYSEIYWTIELCHCYLDSKDFNIEPEKILTDLQTRFSNFDSTIMLHLKAKFYYAYGRYLRLTNNPDKENFSKALDCFKISISLYNILESTMDIASEISLAYNAMGNACFDKKEYDNALEYHQKAISKMKSVLPKASMHLHSHMSLFKFNIGTIYFKKAEQNMFDTNERDNELRKALAEFSASIAIDREIKTDRHVQFADKLSFRSNAYKVLEKFDKAVADMKEVIKIRRSSYHKMHPQIISAYHILGNLYLKWREKLMVRCEATKTYLRKAVKYFRKAEELIDEGGDLPDNSNAQQFIKDYQRIADNRLVNDAEANNIRRFLRKFKGRLFGLASSSPSTSPSTSSASDSNSSQNSIDDESLVRQDSGTYNEECLSDNAMETEHLDLGNEHHQQDSVFCQGLPSAEADKVSSANFFSSFVNKLQNQSDVVMELNRDNEYNRQDSRLSNDIQDNTDRIASINDCLPLRKRKWSSDSVSD